MKLITNGDIKKILKKGFYDFKENEKFEIQIKYKKYTFNVKLVFQVSSPNFIKKNKYYLSFDVGFAPIGSEFYDFLPDGHENHVDIYFKMKKVIKNKKFGPHNFFENTDVTGQTLGAMSDRELQIFFKEFEGHGFDYISASGSKYFYSRNFVVRYADHGGRVASCNGELDDSQGYLKRDMKDVLNEHFKNLGDINFKLSSIGGKYEKSKFYKKDDFIGFIDYEEFDRGRLYRETGLPKYILDTYNYEDYEFAFAYGEDFKSNIVEYEFEELTFDDFERDLFKFPFVKYFDILIRLENGDFEEDDTQYLTQLVPYEN